FIPGACAFEEITGTMEEPEAVLIRGLVEPEQRVMARDFRLDGIDLFDEAAAENWLRLRPHRLGLRLVGRRGFLAGDLALAVANEPVEDFHLLRGLRISEQLWKGYGARHPRERDAEVADHFAGLILGVASRRDRIGIYEF